MKNKNKKRRKPFFIGYKRRGHIKGVSEAENLGSL